MNGDRLNLQDRLLRRARYWRDRRREAPDAATEARLAWEQVRADIHDLPDEGQEEAWRDVSLALDRVGCQFDTRVNDPNGSPTRRGATRARTRGGQPNTSRKEGSR